MSAVEALITVLGVTFLLVGIVLLFWLMAQWVVELWMWSRNQ